MHFCLLFGIVLSAALLGLIPENMHPVLESLCWTGIAIDSFKHVKVSFKARRKERQTMNHVHDVVAELTDNGENVMLKWLDESFDDVAMVKTLPNSPQALGGFLKEGELGVAIGAIPKWAVSKAVSALQFIGANLPAEYRETAN